MKYTDQASLLWELLSGKDNLPLFQIQIQHLAQRAVTFRLRDSWIDFLRASHAADNTMPANLQELESRAGIRIMVTDKADFYLSQTYWLIGVILKNYFFKGCD